MWLSEMLTRGGERESAECGTVTIGGGSAAVLLSGEARNLETACPAGLDWLPEAGQQVVVLHTADGERFIVGALGTGNADLEGGEVRVYSQGASLTIKNNGEIHISGRLFVNGVEIGGEV